MKMLAVNRHLEVRELTSDDLDEMKPSMPIGYIRRIIKIAEKSPNVAHYISIEHSGGKVMSIRMGVSKAASELGVPVKTFIVNDEYIGVVVPKIEQAFA